MWEQELLAGLAATGVGIYGQVFGNAAMSVTSYASSRIFTGKEVNVKDLLINGAAGAVSGFVGGPGADGKALTLAWKSAQKQIAREVRRANVKYATKQIAIYAVQKAIIKKAAKISITRLILGGIAAKNMTK